MQKCLEMNCTKAGTHGDPRWPLARVCREHAKPTDRLLIGDVAPQPPANEAQERVDSEDAE